MWELFQNNQSTRMISCRPYYIYSIFSTAKLLKIKVYTPTQDALGALLERVGVAEEPVDIVTPALFGRNLMKAAGGAMRHPFALAGVTAKLAAGTMTATTAALSRAVGGGVPGPVAPARGDRRFDDAAWRDNPVY